MRTQLKKAGISALAVPLFAVGAALMPPAVAAQSGSAPSVRGLPDFTDLVDQVGPAVVNIRTMERVRASGGGGAGDEDERECSFDEAHWYLQDWRSVRLLRRSGGRRAGATLADGCH